MAATTTAGVSLDDFKKIIEGAVSRGGNRYAHRKAIHIHWKKDQTRPEKDLSALEKLCSLLNFSTPESIVIDESDPTPGHTMRTKIGNKVQDAALRTGRTILIVHYAEHGTDNGTGGLVLSDRTGKKLARADLLLATVEPYELDDNEPLDVLFIFYCCFSFLATREMITGSRIVEVLAANNALDPIAFGAKSAHSFTSKLYMEIRRRAHAGDKLIEIADVMDFLQQTAVAKRPSHTVKIGLGSIVLSLIPSSNTRLASSPALPPNPTAQGFWLPSQSIQRSYLV